MSGCSLLLALAKTVQFRGGRGGGGQRPQRTDYTEVPRQNDLFEQYYNELGIVQDSELDAFWNALRRDLPNSFRFAGSRGYFFSEGRIRRELY